MEGAVVAVVAAVVAAVLPRRSGGQGSGEQTEEEREEEEVCPTDGRHCWRSSDRPNGQDVFHKVFFNFPPFFSRSWSSSSPSFTPASEIGENNGDWSHISSCFQKDLLSGAEI